MDSDHDQLESIIEHRQTERTIQRLLIEPIPEPLPGRRHEARRTFCRPVSLILDDGKMVVTGFSRDISPSGIGLMHSFALESGEIVVQIPSTEGEPAFFRVEVLWCKRLAADWYMSGGRILEQLAAK